MTKIPCDQSGRAEIVAEFQDAVEGDGDRVNNRPGFKAMLKRVEANGVRTIIVERASRFAQDKIIQQVGYAKLRERGIDLIAAGGPDSFISADARTTLVAQVIEIATSFDEVMNAARLRGAGERLKVKSRRVSRRTYAELAPEATLMAKRLHQAGLKSGSHFSLREISAELAKAGHVTKTGKSYHPQSIRSMIKGRRPLSQKPK